MTIYGVKGYCNYIRKCYKTEERWLKKKSSGSCMNIYYMPVLLFLSNEFTKLHVTSVHLR